MGIGLLILSLIFQIFSNVLLLLDKKRIKNKYEDIKARALDLLFEDDVNKILDNDKEYNSELIFLKNRIWIYNILWLVTIAIFFTVLAYTSDFI